MLRWNSRATCVEGRVSRPCHESKIPKIQKYKRNCYLHSIHNDVPREVWDIIFYYDFLNLKMPHWIRLLVAVAYLLRSHLPHPFRNAREILGTPSSHQSCCARVITTVLSNAMLQSVQMRITQEYWSVLIFKNDKNRQLTQKCVIHGCNSIVNEIRKKREWWR